MNWSTWLWASVLYFGALVYLVYARAHLLHALTFKLYFYDAAHGTKLLPPVSSRDIFTLHSLACTLLSNHQSWWSKTVAVAKRLARRAGADRLRAANEFTRARARAPTHCCRSALSTWLDNSLSRDLSNDYTHVVASQNGGRLTCERVSELPALPLCVSPFKFKQNWWAHRSRASERASEKAKLFIIALFPLHSTTTTTTELTNCFLWK